MTPQGKDDAASAVARGLVPRPTAAMRQRPHYYKRIRLQASAYAQPGAICSITIAVRDRRPVFSDGDVAAAAVEVLGKLAAETKVPVYAYCVMPDHVHLLVAPAPGCDIITFVGRFKNLTQRAAWQHGTTGAFWQKSFWDHFLRADDDLERVATYILNNPVRKGLAQEWRQYPFYGTLELEL